MESDLVVAITDLESVDVNLSEKLDINTDSTNAHKEVEMDDLKENLENISMNVVNSSINTSKPKDKGTKKAPLISKSLQDRLSCALKTSRAETKKGRSFQDNIMADGSFNKYNKKNRHSVAFLSTTKHQAARSRSHYGGLFMTQNAVSSQRRGSREFQPSDSDISKCDEMTSDDSSKEQDASVNMSQISSINILEEVTSEDPQMSEVNQTSPYNRDDFLDLNESTEFSTIYGSLSNESPKLTEESVENLNDKDELSENESLQEAKDASLESILVVQTDSIDEAIKNEVKSSTSNSTRSLMLLAVLLVIVIISGLHRYMMSPISTSFEDRPLARDNFLVRIDYHQEGLLLERVETIESVDEFVDIVDSIGLDSAESDSTESFMTSAISRDDDDDDCHDDSKDPADSMQGITSNQSDQYQNTNVGWMRQLYLTVIDAFSVDAVDLSEQMV